MTQILAVSLLSGGIDSTLATAIAAEHHGAKHVLALNVDYGQRAINECEAAQAIATHLGVSFVQVRVPLVLRSALTGGAEVPLDRPLSEILEATDVAPTYVPGRNLILLALALAKAESLGARRVVFGVNVHDRRGYPDCRPDFVEAVQRCAVEGLAKPVRIWCPCDEWDKAEIIAEARRRELPIQLCVSCYHGTGCNRCDACRLRGWGIATASATRARLDDGPRT